MKKEDFIKKTDKIERYSQCKIIGERSPSILFKYMPIEYALKSLEDNYLYFQQLTQWDDQYEKRFYSANYSQICVDNKITPKVHACCFTSKKLNEAHVNAYINNKEKVCIRFEINTSKLRKCLEQYAKCNPEIKVYEGKVYYGLSDAEIDGLHKKKRPYHAICFKNLTLDAYLSLLLIKRNAFEHEQEIRFFIDNKSESCNPSLFISINWGKVIESILVIVKDSWDGYDDFVSLCEKKCIKKDKIHLFNLYAMKDFPITIEK